MSEMLGPRERRKPGAYFDVDGLYAIGTIESYITTYGAESTI
jgi:hypothetical protein